MKIKINNKNFIIGLFTFLLVLSFFWPTGHIGSIMNIIKLVTILISFIYTCLILINQRNKKYKIPNISLYLILYYLVLFVSSFINSIEYASLDTILSILRFTVFIIVIDFLIRNYKEASITGSFYAVAIIVVWDIIQIMIYPNGFFQGGQYYDGVYYNTSMWLLGNKNNHCLYFMAFIFLSYFKYINNKNLLNKFLLIISCTLTIVASIILSSSTTIVVIGVSFLGLILSFIIKNKNNKTKKLKISINSFLIYFLLINVILYFCDLDFLLPITKIFGKTPTFSSRTIIWHGVSYMILIHPLLGWGNVSNEFLTSYLQIPQAYNAHNQIMDTFLRGGIVLLIILLLIIYVLLNSINRMKYKKEKTFLVFFILALMINMLFEQIFSSYLIGYLLVLIFNLSKIDIKNIKDAR